MRVLMVVFDDVLQSKAQSRLDRVSPIGFSWRCGHDVVMGMTIS